MSSYLCDRTLVILSMVRPDRTTIFSIDNKLNAELLYDSFNKNILISKDKSWSLGSIFRMQVIRAGYFYLEERLAYGEEINSSQSIRIFILDVTAGKFKISLK